MRRKRTALGAAFGALGLLALILATARCGTTETETCVNTGDLCKQGGKAGVCFGKVCQTDTCVIKQGSHLAGAVNPKNGCEVCNPSKSRSEWTTFVCPLGQDDCLSPNGECQATALGGACRGPECCVYQPAWNGQGTAPECTYGTAKGTCDAAGRCTGVCTQDTDCAGGKPCVSATCETATGTCITTPQADGSTCPFTTADDGKCVAGKCVKQCTSQSDCGTGQCGSDGYCVARKANGETCLGDTECQSSHCECVDSPCSIRVCAAQNCICGYGTSGSCTSGMMGVPDPEDCDAQGYGCSGVNTCKQ